MMTETQLREKIQEHQEMVMFADGFINKRRKEQDHPSIKYWEKIKEFYQDRIKTLELVLNYKSET